ncbi:MAG: M23 family metallopeptidase, partial [Paracoccaceae bacterium]
PAPAPAPAPSGQADGRGVVYYDGYESIRARSGDTVDTMAARVGISGSELAAYNGLSTQYTPREGDELVLPARNDRYQGGAMQSAAQVATASSAYPGYEPSTPAQPGAVAAPAQPAGAWSADLAREAIQTAPDSSVSSQPLAPPPVAEAPPIAEEQTASMSTDAPAAPPAAASQSASSAGGFAKPVDAAISRPYSRASGPERNDGVDFATAAGDPVRAAAAGEVALISQSLGGLGTIVLIRHENDLLTVYGRIDGVTVAKGERVSQGQTIARVADLPPPQGPSLHFEIRRGAESIDPAPYL